MLQARTGCAVCAPPVPSGLTAADSARLVLSFTELVAKYQEQGRAARVVKQEPAAPMATPAMLEAAAASDMREAFPFFDDTEQPWTRDTLFGHAELALAND